MSTLTSFLAAYKLAEFVKPQGTTGDLASKFIFHSGKLLDVTKPFPGKSVGLREAFDGVGNFHWVVFRKGGGGLESPGFWVGCVIGGVLFCGLMLLGP